MSATLREALGALAKEGPTGLLAQPRTERELADALHVLKDRGARLHRDVGLSRAGFAGLGRVEERSMTAVAGAGVRLDALERALSARALTLGPLPPAATALELGDFLEGPYAGLRAIPGGRLEPLVTQLEGVLADGRHVHTMTGPRNATGPDLAALFLGAGGRLGLVTEALVRAFPRPERHLSAELSLPSAAAAVELLEAALAGGVWLWSARLGAHQGRVIAVLQHAGSDAVAAADREQLSRALEAAQGHLAAAPPLEVPLGPERECTWEAVRTALERGRPVELFRLSLASVVARGEVEGLLLEGEGPWAWGAALAARVDPHAVLGGAR